MNRDEKHARKPSPRENFSEKRMYYEKLADKYRIAKFLILILLAFFIVSGRQKIKNKVWYRM